MARSGYNLKWRHAPLSGRLIVLIAILIVVGVGSSALAAWKLWSDANSSAKTAAHNLGVVLAEQTVRSVQAADFILQEIEGDIQNAGVTTPAGFADKLGSRAFFDAMSERMKDLPQASAISIFAPDGSLISFTRRWPTPALNFQDRDYVQYCQQPSHDGLFISSQVLSRAAGLLLFYVARCVTGPDNRLLGIVAAAMKIEYFMNFYASIGLPDRTSVAIRRLGGDALVRFPNTGPDAPSRSASAGSDGRSIQQIPLSSYPLTIDIGLSRQTAFAQWRRQVMWIGVALACGILCLLILLNRLLAVVGRFERLQVALIDRNNALKAAKHSLKGQTLTLTRTADALRQSESRLAKQSEVLETTLEHMNQGLMMITASRVVAVCNKRAMEMLNLPPALMLSQPSFSDVLAYQWRHEEFSGSPADLKEFVRAGGILDQPQTYERVRPDGTILEVCSLPLEAGGIVRTYTDITQRRAAEERLRFLAYHDELTGLANRHRLHQALQDCVDGAAQTATGLALLYLDLDRFKLVNDTRGHEAGNALLKDVAERMGACVPENATIARIGGDEFAVVLPGVDTSASAVAIAEDIKRRVSEPYVIGHELSRVGVSIGVALYPQDGASPEILLRSADSALYRAKDIGRNAVCCHESARELDVRGRLLLEQDLRIAVQAEQFELAYQPIFDIETGLPRSMEALIRWRHPSRGLLSPTTFIELAETTGAINDIGRWVLQTACREAATWALPARLAVNLSSVQFAQADLEAQVVAALAASGLPADRLDLEVTESVLISDTEQVRDTMLALRRRGIRLVMDDFGTGHSSLKALQGFPFQQIKIDRSFVASIHDEAGAGAIIRAILSMAASMKLDVVAEGIETPQQLEALRGLGCRYLQGYLLERPRTPQWIRDFLWRCTTVRVDEWSEMTASPGNRLASARET